MPHFLPAALSPLRCEIVGILVWWVPVVPFEPIIFRTVLPNFNPSFPHRTSGRNYLCMFDPIPLSTSDPHFVCLSSSAYTSQWCKPKWSQQAGRNLHRQGEVRRRRAEPAALSLAFLLVRSLMSQFSTGVTEVGGRDGRRGTLDYNFTEIFSHFLLSLLWPHYSEMWPWWGCWEVSEGYQGQALLDALSHHTVYLLFPELFSPKSRKGKSPGEPGSGK